MFSASSLPRRIAVIDADGGFRDLVCEWLNEAGYSALALPVPIALTGAVHLVVLDLAHLRHSGRQTVAGVRRLFVGVPILGLSTQLVGHLPAYAQAALQLGLDHLLAKPCQRDELIACVRTMLDAG